MSLYESIAASYDELFPLPKAATAFLDSLVRDSPWPRRVLDIGCATGAQALALAARGWLAAGLDSETAMIEVARARAAREGLSSRASFSVGDMRDLGSRFERASLDLVLCLGNTLPHLAELRPFLSEAGALLKSGGALVLQLLNYSRPGTGPGFSFTEAKAPGLTMRRHYERAAEEEKALRFVVELQGAKGVSIEETILHPIFPKSLAALLEEAGLGGIDFRPSWDAALAPAGQAFDEGRDQYLIAIARPVAEARGRLAQ
jgi:glycine/sarcosine N-methyltransferase